jgi:hypothetical protein
MIRSRLLLGLCLLGLGPSCAPSWATLRLDSRLPARAAAAHALKVAVLPIADGRLEEEGDDDEDRFVYRGTEYVGTRLERLGPEPLTVLTERLAQHLAGAGVFETVILVLDPDDAPEADLLLESSLLRARGYVEPERSSVGAPVRTSSAAPAQRRVLAEFVLRRVRVRDARRPERLLFDADAGWSLAETRTATAALDPYGVLAEAMQEALDGLCEALLAAELSSGAAIPPEVHLSPAPAGEGSPDPLGALAARAPTGWTAERAVVGELPLGWRGEPRCDRLTLTQGATRRFHRALGPYRPAVTLWACPLDARLSFDARVDFPARLLGESADGHRWFGHALGESNWPEPEIELVRALGLVRPSSRHIFEVGPGAPPPRGPSR